METISINQPQDSKLRGRAWPAIKLCVGVVLYFTISASVWQWHMIPQKLLPWFVTFFVISLIPISQAVGYTLNALWHNRRGKRSNKKQGAAQNMRCQ